jgi:glycosyltransferase involved in cell wall biosynthesis
VNGGRTIGLSKRMKGISVIIPVYNREAFLEEAIRSVLRQHYEGPVETIVSDDGSTDRSCAIAEAIGPPVRLLRKPLGCSGQGASSARNRGISAATQPFVAFLDSDDFYLPGHLQHSADVLENRTRLGFVFARMLQLVGQNGQRRFAPWTRTVVTRRDICHPVVSGGNIIHTNVILIRRKVLDVAGVFDERYVTAEDSDLWMRISECCEGAFAGHYGAVYRIRHGRDQLTARGNSDTLRRNLKDIFCGALDRCQSHPGADRYRLFRLRLIASAFATWRRMSLLGVCCRHPLRAMATAISPSRLPARVEGNWISENDLPTFLENEHGTQRRNSYVS